jgi:ectoine hydroxylase
MELSKSQIEFYSENGYLILEQHISDNIVEFLFSELPNTIEKNSPRIILEDNGDVRSVFAPHFINDSFRKLVNLDRLVIPAEQLLGNKVYLHQYKINIKKGFKGDWWEWHQDFPYWNADDGIQNPDLVSIMIYLQNTDELNGALLLIPKTHKLGIGKFAKKDKESLDEKIKYNDHHESKDYISSVNSNIKFTVDHDLIKEMTLSNGIVSANGKKGTVLFFHCNIFHASNINLTPFDRNAIIITYNSVNNLPFAIQNPRPEFLASRDYEPINDLVADI